MRRILSVAGALLLGCFASRNVFAQIAPKPVNATGVYHEGETIGWDITAPTPLPTDISYVLKRNGLTAFDQGAIDLSAGPKKIEASLKEPGDVLMEITSTSGGRKVRTLAGALMMPEKLQPAMPRPADFDDFWAARIKALGEIPQNARLEAADSGRADVDYTKVTMDNINGTHIYAQLARPKKDGRFPALLILQWAGVYGLQKQTVVSRAQQGWLAMNVMPHDLPLDQPAAFYTQAGNTTQKDYYTRGNDSRDTSDFLRMYLAAYRCAEYLSKRDDWDGKTLVVMGTSMGGQQTLTTTGLFSKVTAMMACVPSSCDATGPAVGRAAAFPDWASQAKAKNNPKILETSRYFDPENFAPRIKVPAIVALGLIDETCPAAGVYAAANQLAGPKEIMVMVDSDHQGKNNSQAPYNTRAEQWLKAMATGAPAPVKQ